MAALRCNVERCGATVVIDDVDVSLTEWLEGPSVDDPEMSVGALVMLRHVVADHAEVWVRQCERGGVIPMSVDDVDWLLFERGVDGAALPSLSGGEGLPWVHGLDE